jgi:hypothetical protein
MNQLCCKYIAELKPESKRNLMHGPMDQVGLFNGKTQKLKSRDTVPVKKRRAFEICATLTPGVCGDYTVFNSNNITKTCLFMTSNTGIYWPNVWPVGVRISSPLPGGPGGCRLSSAGGAPSPSSSRSKMAVKEPSSCISSSVSRSCAPQGKVYIEYQVVADVNDDISSLSMFRIFFRARSD